MWRLLLMILILSCGTGAGENVRPSALAGTWYPAEAEMLESDIRQFLDQADGSPDESLVALISPHAGYRFSGLTAAHGYAAVPKGKFNRVIVLAPTHHAAFHGASIGDFDVYQTPLGDVPLDKKACRYLMENPLVKTNSMAHKREHSIEIQLPFLQVVLERFDLIPLLVGDLSTEEQIALGKALIPLWDDKTLLVISSDFTHYGQRFGYVPFDAVSVDNLRKELLRLNTEASEIIRDGDCKGFSEYLSRTRDTICGRKPIGILLGILRENTTGKELHYSTSLDVMPAIDSSVSYLSIGFFRSGGKEDAAMAEEEFHLTGQDKKVLVMLAREAVRARLEGREAPNLNEWKAKMGDSVSKPAGTFVTLKIGERLRGCIGYIEPIKPLIEAITDNAISAAFNDSRFRPLTKGEWAALSFKLSVLTPLVSVEDVSEIEVGRHGLILSAEGRRGVFLPEVPVEQGWDIDTYLQELGRKAGLDREAWKRARLERFESIVFGDELLTSEEKG